MSENKLSEEFETEVEKINAENLMPSAYKKRKLIAYGIRTTLAIVLYIALWRYVWFRWTLLFYVPLNLFGLATILGYNYYINKKIEKSRKKIEAAEEVMKQSEEHD